jgi:hypothetical protein
MHLLSVKEDQTEYAGNKKGSADESGNNHPFSPTLLVTYFIYGFFRGNMPRRWGLLTLGKRNVIS